MKKKSAYVIYEWPLSKREIPTWARRLIFGTYCRLYQVNLDEAIESDLTQYPTLNEFFRRKLKPECRPIDQNADLVVPCDGKGGFQLLDLIITELKRHMTFKKSRSLIGGNFICQKNILYKICSPV